jgi:predicted glycosyltransferase
MWASLRTWEAAMADRTVNMRQGPDRNQAGRLPVRVLIYSHDTFGLGHLRRTRAIANATVEAWPDASVVIISGSPVIGNFEFGPGVDYIRIPGVTKLPAGDYRSLNLNVPLEEAVRLRQALILRTAETFRPDVFIVDKEPAGFRGEVLPALEFLKMHGCRLVLGVRDVLDEPSLLVPEWERKGAKDALARYDEIWVYGLKAVYEPLAALDLPPEARGRITYTGYLRRDVPKEPALVRHPKITKQPFILVTTGGGGDGDDVMDWVISAYESEPDLDMPALLVFGPFINRDRRGSFMERIAKHPKLDALTFDTKIELLMQKAAAVVAMGGYNTFCEILSLDKRALIVPRTKPRLEQHIRAVEAERLGLARMLSDRDEPRTPERMARALRGLASQPRPSEVVIPGLLDGLDCIRERFRSVMAPQQASFDALAQAAE